MRRVDEFVIDTVIKLAIVVDLILSILVAAPGSKFNKSFLLDHWSLFAVHFFKLTIITHRAVERSEYH